LKAESIDVSDEGRGVWVWASSFCSPDEIHETFSLFSKIGLNSVFFLVKDSNGCLYYNSSFEPWHVKDGYGWDPLAVAIREAHNLGLELHAWFVVFRDMAFVKENPELAAWHINGNISREWVCPAREDVRERLLMLIKEIATNYPVDGIHLDYIRYENSSYCFCPYCRQKFVDETGRTPDPKDPSWIDWRCRQITEFVDEVYKMLKRIRFGVKLSAAVRPKLNDAIANRGQNWTDWLEKLIIDFVIPMAYTNSTSEFKAWLENIIASTQQTDRIYPGIGVARGTDRIQLLTGTQLLEQINITRSLCFRGHVLFRYHKDFFTPEIVDAIEKAYSLKIRFITQNPPINNVQPYQNVTVSVNVTDYKSGPERALLCYSTDGLSWTEVQMHPIAIACNTSIIFEGTIPGMPAGTRVQYQILAFNKAGIIAKEDNAGQYYVYMVIPEFTNWLLLILMLLATAATSTMRLAKNNPKYIKAISRASGCKVTK